MNALARVVCLGCLLFAAACRPGSGPCAPVEDRARLTVIYLAEAEPIVESGACKGFTTETCPALAEANARHAARRKAFVECRQ